MALVVTLGVSAKNTAKENFIGNLERKSKDSLIGNLLVNFGSMTLRARTPS